MLKILKNFMFHCFLHCCSEGNGNSFPATYLCLQCQQHFDRVHQYGSVRHPGQTNPENTVPRYRHTESLEPRALPLPHVGPQRPASTQVFQGIGGEPVL